MTLAHLSDEQLHSQAMALASEERRLLTSILRHLREIDRRKLFSDFGCSSLFDYAVRLLGYSEGQAHRRIQAMRLMKELPQIENKIANGALSLSNIAQAQTVFNELRRQNNAVQKSEKAEILARLEHKSAREGQRELFKLKPEALSLMDTTLRERERSVGDGKLEVTFFVDQELQAKLEEVRSLMGPDGLRLTYNELFKYMADLSLTSLLAKRFGKKRTQRVTPPEVVETAADTRLSTTAVGDSAADTRLSTSEVGESAADARLSTSAVGDSAADTRLSTSAVGESATDTRLPTSAVGDSATDTRLSTSAVAGSAKSSMTGSIQASPSAKQTTNFEVTTSVARQSKSQRYIPAAIKHLVWTRDMGKCRQCGSKRNLNYDHVLPVAKNGDMIKPENLRLLCFQCNQRAAVKEFGAKFMENKIDTHKR